MPVCACASTKWRIAFVVPNVLGVDPPRLTFDLRALQRTCFGLAHSEINPNHWHVFLLSLLFEFSFTAFLLACLELLRSVHGRQFDRLKTGNYASDQPFTDWSQFDIKPLFLIGGRLIGASLFSCSDWMLAGICHSEGLRLEMEHPSQPTTEAPTSHLQQVYGSI